MDNVATEEHAKKAESKAGMPQRDQAASETVRRMSAVGAHLAYTRSRRHPSVTDFIYGKKDKLDVIDLKKTEDLLEKARNNMRELGSAGKTVLFVGTKPEARIAIEEHAKPAGHAYVVERWIGGLLTNWSEVKKRIERLKQLKEERQKGELEKYTKKEQLLIEKETNDLERNFGGVAELTKLPDALFIIDPREEDIAVREATKTGIPTIALANSDCDITRVIYPIVANDAALASIRFFTKEIVDAYNEGKKEIRGEIKEENTEASASRREVQRDSE